MWPGYSSKYHSFQSTTDTSWIWFACGTTFTFTHFLSLQAYKCSYVRTFFSELAETKVQALIVSYRGDLDGLWQGQLGNWCSCRGWDVGPSGAVLLAGWMLHSSSQELSLGLLDQQLLLRWGQGQLRQTGRKQRHRSVNKSNMVII